MAIGYIFVNRTSLPRCFDHSRIVIFTMNYKIFWKFKHWEARNYYSDENVESTFFRSDFYSTNIHFTYYIVCSFFKHEWRIFYQTEISKINGLDYSSTTYLHFSSVLINIPWSNYFLSVPNFNKIQNFVVHAIHIFFKFWVLFSRM